MITFLADPHLAQNAGRRYPLADDTAGLKDYDHALLEFRCRIFDPHRTTVPVASLTKVENMTGGGRTVTVTVATGATPAPTLVFNFPSTLADTEPYTAVAGAGVLRGELTVTAAVLTLPTGTYAIPFAATTVLVDALKVFSVQAVSPYETGTGYDAVLTGKVTLVSGKNAEPYLDGQHLRLDVYKGAGTGEACQTAAVTGQFCDNVLFTINGEKPGSDGEIRLVGTSGVTVTPKPDEHALEISLDETAKNTLLTACTPACS